jgi:hypothetical protein
MRLALLSLLVRCCGFVGTSVCNTLTMCTPNATFECLPYDDAWVLLFSLFSLLFLHLFLLLLLLRACV